MAARLAIWSLATVSAWGQSYAPGPQVLTFLSSADDSRQPYAVYVPKGFEPTRKYPLVVSLHGAGSNHRLNLRRVFGRGNRPGEGDGEASRRFPPLPEVDFLVVSPLARGTMGYQGLAEKDVYDVLADVKARFPVDEDRIYLTGLSMGGGGALWLGLTRPDIWAAIAGVCPAAPEETVHLAANALNVPVRLFHGALDPVVAVEVSRLWHKRLLHEDVRVDYIEYPGVRHNSWDAAYRDAAIFSWFAGHRRERFPQRVRYTTRRYQYGSAYWVRFDGLTPGTPASIDARFVGKNRLRIDTSGLHGFSLLVDGHPEFASGQASFLAIDGRELRVPARGPLSFLKARNGWRQGRYTPGPGEKKAGAEGPISSAVASRHVYVYGTADSPPAWEQERRRAEATTASNWNGRTGRLLTSFRVTADAELSDADARDANLVLFGSSKTNSWIARYGSQLPLELNAGAADYGLLFITPVEGRYVVVNSGLPWWMGAEQMTLPGFSFQSPVFRALPNFSDYILFRGSREHVVAEGLFDRDWKLAPEQAARLSATGAVRVR